MWIEPWLVVDGKREVEEIEPGDGACHMES
jgi:hypothetical protein